MKIELPLETWTDVFGFLRRSQLVLLVPHIKKTNTPRGRKCEQTIRDRKFVSVVQFYLHKCGQITIDEMSIKPPKNKRSMAILKINGHYPQATREIALPKDLPMPENVTDFRKIHLNYVDGSVLGFLKRFQCNGLLNNVNLMFSCNIDEVDCSRGILVNILHLITSINSIEFHGQALSILQNRKGQQTVPILTARFLRTSYGTDLSDDWYCNWLYTPRADCKPRFLKVHFDHGRAIPFIEHVKENFGKTNQAISFFIHIFIFPNGQNVPTQTLDNCKTRECFVINGYQSNEYPVVTILRHPIGATAEWIEEMDQEGELQHRTIIIIDI